MRQHLDSAQTEQEVGEAKQVGLGVRNRYLTELGVGALTKWTQYGAPYDPIPEQESLNSLPGDLSARPYFQDIEFAETPERISASTWVPKGRSTGL